MKLASTLALAAALAIGGAATAIAKEKPAAATPGAYNYNLSKGFRAVAAPAQAALKAGDKAGAAAKLTELDAVAVNPDEKYVAAQFRLQLAGMNSDAAGQRTAVDAMITSGSPGAQPDLGKLNFYSGQFAYQAGDYPKAQARLAEAERLGYTSGDMYLLLAEASFKAKQIPAGLAYVDKAIAASQAAGTKPPETWYKRAASVAYQTHMGPESALWMRKLVTAYPTPSNWRDALVIYRDSANLDGNINLDLYRLMRLTKSLAGERDYYEYANLASERGLPGETKAVIDEGFAANAVPAGSRALTELRTMASGKVASDRTSLAANERQAAASATGKIAASTGDAYLGYGEDAKAIALYRVALQKGGVDADAVNTRLGIALTRSGDKAGARTAFAAVKGPRADVAAFWTLWIDQQGA